MPTHVPTFTGTTCSAMVLKLGVPLKRLLAASPSIFTRPLRAYGSATDIGTIIDRLGTDDPLHRRLGALERHVRHIELALLLEHLRRQMRGAP